MADPVYKRPGIKKRWCPTQVDESGNYVIGQWAYCSDNCPDSNDITKKGNIFFTKIIVSRWPFVKLSKFTKWQLFSMEMVLGEKSCHFEWK